MGKKVAMKKMGDETATKQKQFFSITLKQLYLILVNEDYTQRLTLSFLSVCRSEWTTSLYQGEGGFQNIPGKCDNQPNSTLNGKF